MYQLNSPTVIAENFDDEFVIVNLQQGIYFSLRNTAAHFWSLLMSGFSTTEILTNMLIIYQCDEKELSEDLNFFIENLLAEQIIVQSSIEKPEQLILTAPKDKLPYNKPVIERFNDMQEILLLDPVHDVDREGWPISKEQEP